LFLTYWCASEHISINFDEPLAATLCHTANWLVLVKLGQGSFVAGLDDNAKYVMYFNFEEMVID